MNPRVLSANLEADISSPDFMPVLRRAIKGMAIRGILCSQPGQLRAPRSNELAALWDIPAHWQTVRLSEIATPQAGFAFDSKNFNTSGRGLPLIRIRDIRSSQTESFYAGEYRDDFLVSTGEYLIGMDGNFNVACWRGPRALLNQRVTRLRWTSSAVLPEFVVLSLQEYLWSLQGKKQYTTVDHLSTKQIAAAPIPLPPLAEQRHIVAKVDELMALCDRLEAQLQERDARSADLAKAALAKFSEEPTVENLEYLFHPSFSVAIADLRRMILASAVEGVLVPFPKQTVASVVGDHIEFLNGYAFKSEWFRRTGIRLCRNINVGHGEVTWSETECVSADVAEEFRRFALASGDVVLSLDRPLISTGLKAARIRSGDLPCLLLQRVAKASPRHAGIDPDFFFLWLQSPAFVDSIDPGRSNGVPHISTKQVASLPIRVPPLAEQRRIVAKVEELMALVDQLEAQLAASEEVGTKLLDALVAELAPSN